MLEILSTFLPRDQLIRVNKRRNFEEKTFHQNNT
jgi:hypothetical protein